MFIGFSQDPTVTGRSTRLIFSGHSGMTWEGSIHLLVLQIRSLNLSVLINRLYGSEITLGLRVANYLEFVEYV